MTAPRIAHVASDGRRITWHCSTCDEPLNDGWIELRGDQMRLAYDSLRREAEIEAQHRANGITSAAEYFDLPGPGRWRATCRTCNGDDQGSGYFIEVDRITTLAALIDWSAHLSGKVWTEHTDWDDVLRLVAAAASRRAAA